MQSWGRLMLRNRADSLPTPKKKEVSIKIPQVVFKLPLVNQTENAIEEYIYFVKIIQVLVT
jgi:hypothetical protein